MSRLLLLAIMLFGITSAAFSQGTIKGKVTDDQGAPLSGANVFIKGTTIGTISDMDGNYQLDNVPAGNNTLVVSLLVLTILKPMLACLTVKPLHKMPH